MSTATDHAGHDHARHDYASHDHNTDGHGALADHDHDHCETSSPNVAIDRPTAVRRAQSLNRFSLGYNVVEAVVALGAGIAAGSVSLIGFGLDSVIEVSASLILTWRLLAERRTGCTQDTDRKATKAIAVSFAALAGYVGFEAIRTLTSGDQPEVTSIGIALTTLSLIVMPFVAREKRKLAPTLGSRAQEAEANQTSICALMSAFVLIGLLANWAFGWWWADPTAALAVAGIAAVEAVRTWKAESLEDTCCG